MIDMFSKLEKKYINYDYLCNWVYDEFRFKILDAISNDGKLDSEDQVKGFVDEIVDDNNIEEIIDMYVKMKTNDYDNCMKIINTFGLEAAVNEYICDNMEESVPFRIDWCARDLLRRCISWDMNEFRYWITISCIHDLRKK